MQRISTYTRLHTDQHPVLLQVLSRFHGISVDTMRLLTDMLDDRAFMKHFETENRRLLSERCVLACLLWMIAACSGTVRWLQHSVEWPSQLCRLGQVAAE